MAQHNTQGVSFAALALAAFGQGATAWAWLQTARALPALPVSAYGPANATDWRYVQAVAGLSAAHAIGHALRRFAGTRPAMPRPLA